MGGAWACIMMVNSPGVLPAALLIRRVVFAYGLPIQPVPGNFFRQYSLSPSLINVLVEQGERINAETLHPPAIDLHLPNIKRLSSYNGLTDQPFRLFPRSWIVRLPGNIDGQWIQSRFLPRYGIDQRGRRLFGPGDGNGGKQKQNCSQGNLSFHGVKPLGVALSEVNKPAPQGRTVGLPTLSCPLEKANYSMM